MNRIRKLKVLGFRFPPLTWSFALLESLSRTCLIAYAVDPMSISSFLDELLQPPGDIANDGGPTQHDILPDDDTWRIRIDEWEKK